MDYGKNTLYVLGTARISQNDPISSLYNIFFIGIIVEKDTGKIIDTTCNMVKDTTTNFINTILVGYNLVTDMDAIIGEINERFLGMAQKAVISSLKDARNKYMMAKEIREMQT